MSVTYTQEQWETAAKVGNLLTLDLRGVKPNGLVDGSITLSGTSSKAYFNALERMAVVFGDRNADPALLDKALIAAAEEIIDDCKARIDERLRNVRSEAAKKGWRTRRHPRLFDTGGTREGHSRNPHGQPR